MNVVLLDVEDLHAEALEERHQRLQRQVGQVLVVDRVVFEVHEQVAEVRRLEDEHAVDR